MSGQCVRDSDGLVAPFLYKELRTEFVIVQGLDGLDEPACSSLVAAALCARLHRWTSLHRYAKRCWRAKSCGQVDAAVLCQTEQEQ